MYFSVDKQNYPPPPRLSNTASRKLDPLEQKKSVFWRGIEQEEWLLKKILIWFEVHNLSVVITINEKNYQLDPLLDFVIQSGGIIKPFKDITPEVDQLLNSLNNNKVEKLDFLGAIRDRNVELGRTVYWNLVRAKFKRFRHLQTSYGLTQFKIDGTDWFDVFSALFSLREKQKLSTYGFNLLMRMAKNGVSSSKIDTKLIKLENIEKTNLWNELIKNRDELVSLIKQHDFSSQILINNKEFQFDAFANFVSDNRNKNAPFTTTLPTKVHQLVDDFFAQGITKEQLSKSLAVYINDKKVVYWNNLKEKLNNLKHLQINYGLDRLEINGQNYLKELNSLIGLQKTALNAITNSAKINLDKLLNDGITIQAIDDKLARERQIRESNLWNVLWKNRTTLSNLIEQKKFSEQMVINKINYRVVFRAFVQFINREDESKTFNTLTKTEKQKLIEPFFEHGVTTGQIEKLFAKLSEEKEEASTKNRSKLALPIGLGVGLGIPVVVSGGGLTYWLVRKYWK